MIFPRAHIVAVAAVLMIAAMPLLSRSCLAQAASSSSAPGSPTSLAGSSGPLTTPTPSTDTQGSSNPVSPTTLIYPSNPDGSPYLLAPGDSIVVHVTPQDKYSTDQIPVMPDGSLDYPKIGRIDDAAGKTVEQLATEIRTKLSDYCVDPDVTVTLASIHPQVVYVSGGVVSAKALDARAATTLAKAITLAGGAVDQYSLTHVAVVRGGHVLTSNMFDLLVNGVDNGQNLPLQPDDLVIVPTETAQFLVLGAVAAPGSYKLEDSASTPQGAQRLSDALAKAGGPDKHGGAKIGSVVILRRSTPQATPVKLTYNYGKFLKEGDINDNPVIQNNDVIVVPEGSHGVGIGSVVDYAPIYLLLRALIP